MMVQEKDDEHLKLKQLYVALNSQPTLNEKYIENIVQQVSDINCQLPAVFTSSSPELIGCTPLHVAYKKGNLKIFNFLLNHGADCTIKNREGSTVLHQIIEDNFMKKALTNNPNFSSALESCINSNSLVNPRNNHGLTHFHAACIAGKSSYVESCLQNGTAPVDHSVNANSPIFAGYTPLHFAVECCNAKITRILLKYGANVNLKNSRRLTALQMAIELKVTNGHKISNYDDEIVLLLAAHKVDDKAVVIDESDGLSLLHVACTLENMSTLKRILSTTQNIDQRVNSDSPILPGSTALHFAAICNLDAVKLLVTWGTDILLKNTSGQTALDLCIERYDVKVVQDILSFQTHRFSNILLSNGASLLDLVLAIDGNHDPYGFCVQKNLASKIFVSTSSPLWPGYSILHAAVIFDEKRCRDGSSAIERILRYNNTIDCHVQPRNETPLHLAFRLQKTVAVDAMMTRPQLLTCCSDVVSRDGLTFLHIACATKNRKLAGNLLLLTSTEVNRQLQADYHWSDLFIPKGSTALHIAVMVESYELVKLLWVEGANLYAKDANGMTPIHWLMISNNSSMSIVDLLLTPSEVPELLASEPELPVPPSPAKKYKKSKTDGAPMVVSSPRVRKKVKRSPNDEVLMESIADNGLTHLHVASFFGKVAAVEKLLQAKSNVDGMIKCDSAHDAEKYAGLLVYAGYTPLNLAMKKQHQDVVHLLIRNGANVLLEKPDGLNPLFDVLLGQLKYHANAFVSAVRGSRELQNRMCDSVGLTMLHLNCYVVNVGEVERSLNRDDFVNRNVNLDSPVWPGFTALHVLIRYYEACSSAARGLFQLLLSRGADVTKSNADGCTPLHLAYYLDINVSEKVHLIRLLLQNHKVFKLNPVDKNGLSHFHIACALVDIGAIKEFLKRGVDVNHSMHCIHDGKLSGCTGLHLVLNQLLNQGVSHSVKLEAVDILIEHGADVHVENSHGNTPLHFAVKCDTWYMDLLKRLLDAGARIDAQNLVGQTVFEILLNSMHLSANDIEFFLQCGYKVNDFNPINHKGYMAITFSKYMNANVKKLILETMFNASCVNELDPLGRNAIHNVISTSRQIISEHEYGDMIGKLWKVGCDINHQDKLGRTPLHIATQFRNRRGIVALLNAGADINVIDAYDKTAFSYALEPSSLYEGSQDNPNQIVQTFVNHVQKLNLCLLTVHEVNQRISAEALKVYNTDVNLSPKFYEQLKLAKKFKIEKTSLTLLDFISGTKAMKSYPYLSGSQRLAIEEYMENVDASSLDELIGIIKLQYKKVLAGR